MHYAVDLKLKWVLKLFCIFANSEILYALYCFIKIVYAAKPRKIFGCKIVRTKKCSHQKWEHLGMAWEHMFWSHQISWEHMAWDSAPPAVDVSTRIRKARLVKAWQSLGQWSSFAMFVWSYMDVMRYPPHVRGSLCKYYDGLKLKREHQYTQSGHASLCKQCAIVRV